MVSFGTFQAELLLKHVCENSKSLWRFAVVVTCVNCVILAPYVLYSGVNAEDPTGTCDKAWNKRYFVFT